MDINSNFFKIIGIIADFIAIATVIAAIPFALFRKNENLLAFKTSRLLHYMVRVAIMILAVLLVFSISKGIYFINILLITGNVNDDNYLWRSGEEVSHVISYFISGVLGVSFAWMICTFIWTSSWNLSKEFLNLFLPKGKLLSKQQPPLEILNATYKTNQAEIDVTSIAKQMVSNNKLTIKASNELFGDPHPGVAKTLVINYRIGTKNHHAIVNEGYTTTVPSID